MQERISSSRPVLAQLSTGKTTFFWGTGPEDWSVTNTQAGAVPQYPLTHGFVRQPLTLAPEVILNPHIPISINLRRENPLL